MSDVGSSVGQTWPTVGDAIVGTPGRVVAIEGDWALVDRGTWGRFGCPVGDLIPAVVA